MTHYELLGVEPDADVATIRSAYLRRARETHPDTGGTSALFAQVSTAWAVLSDPDARVLYDEGLRPGSAGADWGEDVALGASMPSAPRPAPQAPRAEPAPGPGLDRETDRDVLDPFSSPPRVLPSLDEELAPFPRPAMSPPRAGRLVYLGIAGVVGVAAATGATSSPTGEPSTWSHVVTLYAVVLYVAVRGRKMLALDVTSRRRTAAGVLWAIVVLFPAIAFVGVSQGEVAPWSAVTQLVGGVLVGVLAERHVRRDRRWSGAVAAIRDRRALAVQWNRLLRLREEVGETARVERRVLEVHGEPRVMWALLAPTQGRVLASAPEEAPLAWVATLRARVPAQSRTASRPR